MAEATADGALPTITISDESVDLAWWPIDALPENIDLESVPSLIEMGRAALSGA